jgi:ATP adenylyltransferase
MEYLWAPWRIEYIKKADEPGCVLCYKPTEEDDTANYILYRGQKNFIIMNSYPYNAGHLMVAPYRHVADVGELSGQEADEHFRLVRRCVAVLKRVLKADGFNIGMNLGRAAGAGIDQHIHSHIVPRWVGDTSFMPVVADTKVINKALEETYRKLVVEFKE